MKFHQLCSELARPRQTWLSPAFETPEFSAYFQPLLKRISQSKRPRWERDFLVGGNALIKFAMAGESVRFVFHDPALARATLAFGHALDWKAAANAVRLNVLRETVKGGFIQLRAEDAVDDGVAPALIISDTFAEAETLLRANAHRSQFALVRLKGEDHAPFHAMISDLGPRASVASWRDFNQAGEHTVVAALNFGFGDYEI